MLATARAAGDLPSEIATTICESCGLEIMSPSCAMPSAWYSAIDAYPSARWEFAACLARLRTPSVIVEFGCGPGHFLKLAEESGHVAAGFDLDAKAVSIARERQLTAFSDLEELAAHVQSDARACIAVAFHTLEHYTDPTELFAQLRRFRPARYFISVPPARRWTRLLTDQLIGEHEFWDYPPHHQTRWTPEALAAIARAMGLALVSTRVAPLRPRELIASRVDADVPVVVGVARGLSLYARALRRRACGRGLLVELE